MDCLYWFFVFLSRGGFLLVSRVREEIGLPLWAKLQSEESAFL